MAEGLSLTAAVRERTGKGAARALKRTGHIPAVIYGGNQPPIPIALPLKEMTLALYGGGFLTNVMTLNVGGRAVKVLPRDYQRDPVKERLLHIDFLRVTDSSRVTVDVPVSFVDEDACPGLQKDGVLSVAEFTVSVDTAAARIPDNLTASLQGLEIGATIMSDALALPDGVHLVAEEPFPIASITAPVDEVVEDESEADAEVPTVEEADGDTEGEGGSDDSAS